MIYWTLERRIRNVQRDGVGLEGAGGPCLLGILLPSAHNNWVQVQQADEVCLCLELRETETTDSLSGPEQYQHLQEVTLVFS